MIQLTAHMRVLVSVEPVDFRRGIDGLAALCRAGLGQDPFGGTVFLFCNRRRTAIKILVYDGQGFWLCYKRLSTGRLRWWPAADARQGACPLEVHEAQVLLRGGDPRGTRAAALWRPIDGRAA